MVLKEKFHFLEPGSSVDGSSDANRVFNLLTAMIPGRDQPLLPWKSFSAAIAFKRIPDNTNNIDIYKSAYAEHATEKLIFKHLTDFQPPYKSRFNYLSDYTSPASKKSFQSIFTLLWGYKQEITTTDTDAHIHPKIWRHAQ